MKKLSVDRQSAQSYREWLSSLEDEQLLQILRNRPDTALPLPPGIGSLAARLQLRASVSRALVRLSAIELLVLEAAAAEAAEFAPVSAPEVVKHVVERTETLGEGGPSKSEVKAAIGRLFEFALAFGTPDRFMILPEAMSSLPTGWQLLPDATDVPAPELIDDLDARSLKILHTLANSGGVGLTKDAAPDADPSRPIPQLIAKGLLIRADAGSVRLPRAVRQAVLGESTAPHPLVPTQPAQSSPEEATRAENAGAGAGLEVCRLVRLLIDALSTAPASTLKGGAIGVRVVSRLTRELGVDDAELAALLSISQSAGLIARGVPEPLPKDDDGGDYIAPTPLADEWLSIPHPERWARLLRGWEQSAWAHWRAGEKDEKNKPIHMFAPETHDESVAKTRALIIAELKKLDRESSLPAESLIEQLRYAHPLAMARVSHEKVQALISEAEWIGAYALGHALPVLRALNGDAELVGEASALMPAPTDMLIAQGDMTVMAPGPLVPSVQAEIDVLTELESSGLATVYRVTEGSIKNALNHGRTADDITTFFEQHCPGEVPQSILYLVRDVARRHGTLRGGPAMSYMRCDDPALLLSATQHPNAQKVAMRLIAPTVAIAQAPLIQVLEQLREAGFQPVAEDANGASLSLAPAPSRVATTHAPAQPAASIDEGRLTAAVEAIRRSDAAEVAATSGVRATGSDGAAVQGAQSLSILQAAARSGKTVTLGFVDKHGTAVHRVVKPITVSGGQVDAIDATTGAAHRFSLHRITEVIVN